MLEQILIIVGITFLVMISPGPDMVIVMRNTFVGGRSAGLKSSLGILSGNLVHISYCAIGVGWLVSQSILAFNILKYAGAAYLIYLGLCSFLANGHALEASETPRPPAAQRWFVQGFVNNILNPKGTLFYLGVFTTVITPETSVAATLLLVLIMMLVSASFWLVFVYTLDSGAVRNFFVRSERAINRLFGGLLIALGLRVAVMER